MNAEQKKQYEALRGMGYECDHVDDTGDIHLSLWQRTDESCWRVDRRIITTSGDVQRRTWP